MDTGRELLADTGFSARHRNSPKAFTRERVLTFPVVVGLVMRKSVKALQNVVNEALERLGLPSVSASAVS